MRNKIGRFLPWVVTLALLAWLFSRVQLSDVLHAVRQSASWTVPVLMALVTLIYLADSFAIWKTFGWFLARLSFTQVLVVRGATYLLAVVNYTLGQGAMVYFVHKARGVSVVRGAAAVLLVMGINVLLLLIIVSAGLALAPEVPRGLGRLVMVAYAGLAVYLTLVVTKPRWLTRRPLFDVLFAAGLGGYLKALVVRVPHLLSLLAFSIVYLRAFGVRVPLGQAVLCLPVVYFVAVLPISFLGLGTTQTMMLTFFARYAPGTPPMQEATILASSLYAQMIALSVQAVIGLVCLRNQMARDLRPLPSPP